MSGTPTVKGLSTTKESEIAREQVSADLRDLALRAPSAVTQESQALTALPRMKRTRLHSWGRFPVVNSKVHRPETTRELVNSVRRLDGSELLVRGLGRSYGDAALSASAVTILSRQCSRLLDFDSQNGVVLCDPGMTIGDVLKTCVRQGWFPSFTPGTTSVTMGGAVACDVHGKNHYSEGSFSSHLQSFKLTLASGETVQCSQASNADLYWATLGGMGLTGIISDVQFRLRSIESAYITQRIIPAANIEELLQLMTTTVPEHQYSVAWIDCLAEGADFGRGLLLLGDHAKRSELDARLAESPYAVSARPEFHLPPLPPVGFLSSWGVRLFNSVYYQLQRSQPQSVTGVESFFYPLDFLPKWNRLYGRGGFVQYQCVFPAQDNGQSLLKVMSLIKDSNIGVYLAALKRFGAEQGLLSFPMPGVTLTLDLPISRQLWPFLNRLDDIVSASGGRVYLAKDARLSPESFRAMYKRFPQWLSIKRAVDPRNVFSSALSQRLRMHED